METAMGNIEGELKIGDYTFFLPAVQTYDRQIKFYWKGGVYKTHEKYVREIIANEVNR